MLIILTLTKHDAFHKRHNTLNREKKVCTLWKNCIKLWLFSKLTMLLFYCCLSYCWNHEFQWIFLSLCHWLFFLSFLFSFLFSITQLSNSDSTINSVTAYYFFLSYFLLQTLNIISQLRVKLCTSLFMYLILLISYSHSTNQVKTDSFNITIMSELSWHITCSQAQTQDTEQQQQQRSVTSTFSVNMSQSLVSFTDDSEYTDTAFRSEYIIILSEEWNFQTLLVTLTWICSLPVQN